MERIVNLLKDTSVGKIDQKKYIELRNYLANKSREERIATISKFNRLDLIELFLTEERDMLECYVALSKTTTRDLSDQIYEILLRLQDEDLILKYISYIKLENLIKDLLYYVHDDLKKINYIRNNEYTFDSIKFLVACSLTSDQAKVKACRMIGEISSKVTIILTIKDEQIRADMAMCLAPNFRFPILRTITNQELLIELYYQNKHYSFNYQLLSMIHNDEIKMQELEEYSLQHQIEIIKSLDSEMNIHTIIWNSKYDNYCDIFIEQLTDETFILKYFNKLSNLRLKLKLIKGINNPIIKRKLILLIDDLEYRNILLGNLDGNKDLILKNIEIPAVSYNVDPNITFGVELEACCSCPELYLNLQKILCNWDIKIERTVPDGLEISSPVLRFKEKDLTELRYICNFMKKNEFFVTEKCGGHIHLGFDYFKTIDEFEVFLTLYKNIENILYLISNRCSSKIRDGIDDYARKLSPILKAISKLNINFNTIESLPEYINLIKEHCDSRYYGLNLSNAFTDKHTLEFRMPNGEIKFTELILNIRLFTKLLEKSKQISDILNKEQITLEESEQLAHYKKIISKISNRERLLELLILLFPETDYMEYVNRYNTNKKLKKVKSNNS